MSLQWLMCAVRRPHILPDSLLLWKKTRGKVVFLVRRVTPAPDSLAEAETAAEYVGSDYILRCHTTDNSGVVSIAWLMDYKGLCVLMVSRKLTVQF